MAHQLLTPANAHYLHASLECFDRKAVEVIIGRFERAASTVHAEPGFHSLRYDEKDHVFLLVCGNHVGSALNERLGHIIRDYVASDTTNVKRFAECDVGDPFDDYDVQLEEEVSLPPFELTSSDIHLVNFAGINALGRAKAFRVRELPPALWSRARGRHENLADAISFRRVRWDQKSDQHVLDASVGHELQELTDEERSDLGTLLDVLAFKDFTAKVKILKPHDPKPGFKHFKFVNGDPTVRQWLEGTGETRQVDPSDAPEMLGDAQKFASGPPLQLNPLGRARRPLGMTLSELREPEMTVQPDRSEAQINNSFAALMNSGADGDSDTESNESSTNDASIIENIEPVDVVELVKAASDLAAIEDRAQSNAQSATGDKVDSVLAPISAGFNKAGVASAAESRPLHVGESFPSYDKSYANVDGVGLCGDAVKQVNWENENPAELTTRRYNSRPQTYEALAESRAASVAMSMSVGREIHPKPVTSMTPMSYAATRLGGDEPWANNIVPPVVPVPTGTLISTAESVQGDGRSKAPKFPPGLFPPLGSSGTQQMTTANNPAVQMDSVRVRGHSNVKTTQPSPELEEELVIQLDDDEDHVVERLQPQQESDSRLYQTMRQQAPKNKHSKKGTKASNNKTAPSRAARLELPSPPPPPRPQRATNELQKQKPDAKSVDFIEPAQLYRHRLQQAIANLQGSSTFGAEKADVVIQFGLALMTDAEDLAVNKALRYAEMQEQLDGLPTHCRRTSFVTALGRKDKDGVYLLRLPTTLIGSNSPYDGSSRLVEAWTDGEEHGIIDKKLYEITIVEPGGHSWLLIFGQENAKDVQITSTDMNQQSVFLHYPLRVWDARVRLLPAATNGPEPDSILKRNIMTFLKTFDTPENARSQSRPEFEGTIPNSAFRVTSVLAKRVLTRRTLSSGTWKVTQIWDLHVHMQRQNFAALAKPEQIMEHEGRLWWEAALQYDGGHDDSEMEDLATTMDQIMERLDPVGFDPAAAKKVKHEKSARPREEPYNPYW